MRIPNSAAVTSVGAGPLHAQTLHLVALVSAGALALELWRAEQAAAQLHDIYVRKIREYEAHYGAVDGGINPRDPKHVAIISCTMDERAAMTSAKRKVHAARRRLRTACAKAAREGAANA
jgi:hypothetical protein